MIDAVSYGKALYQLAEEDGAPDALLSELETVAQALAEQRAYATLLDTPALPSEERRALLCKAFAGCSQTVRNFLCLLCDKREIYRVPDCVKAYRACYDEAHNLLRATALTAVEMTPRQRRALTAKLEAITGKTVLLTAEVQPSLLGGVTLRYGSEQLDGSIRSKLDRLRRSLSEAIV